MDSVYRSSNRPPSPERSHFFNLPLVSSLPDLVRQFLINQQGFNVDFGEHVANIDRIFTKTSCQYLGALTKNEASAVGV